MVGATLVVARIRHYHAQIASSRNETPSHLRYNR